MTQAFQLASELVFKTSGDMTKEEMEEFEFYASGFSLEERDEKELDLRSVIEMRQSKPDAKIHRA